MTAQTTTLDQRSDLAGDYQIDPTHSRIGFVVRYAMVSKLRGEFTDFDGGLHIDADDPTRSHVEVRVRMASIHTANDQRDAHLRSADFFDVENHPEMVFTSTQVEPAGGEQNRVRLTGDLTIKGVTRPVTIDLEYTGSARDPFANTRAGFEGRAEISRKDWGLTWNAALETGGFLVGDKVTLDLDVSAVKAGDAEATA